MIRKHFRFKRLILGLAVVFAIALLAVFATLIQTISDTLRLLRTAKRTDGEPPPALARASTRCSGRSRIAA